MDGDCSGRLFYPGEKKDLGLPWKKKKFSCQSLPRNPQKDIPWTFSIPPPPNLATGATVALPSATAISILDCKYFQSLDGFGLSIDFIDTDPEDWTLTDTICYHGEDIVSFPPLNQNVTYKAIYSKPGPIYYVYHVGRKVFVSFSSSGHLHIGRNKILGNSVKLMKYLSPGLYILSDQEENRFLAFNDVKTGYWHPKVTNKIEESTPLTFR
ncbi:hypothetical protein AYI68_g5469 [Smittium mucronatum]|uniref:Uncharacterized protein n=1 Tax=Smittium mucronatum TaxID=133383 RepID=A0A1R0GU75_9FUNG|nr:hypothetical protein AYI68_g5469 [Smittium mucronatum]